VSQPKILILNGPNLNLLGTREPDVYGTLDYRELESFCQAEAKKLGQEVEVRQTNSESELVDWLQEAALGGNPVILNPAAFTHYSYALRDAVAACSGSVIEVHISNPASRERFRHVSVISGVATGTIAGFGFDSYALALIALARGQG
jgi:3-dehydroquinate dehydratase-2